MRLRQAIRPFQLVVSCKHLAECIDDGVALYYRLPSKTALNGGFGAELLRACAGLDTRHV
jgi:hypothetical protein